MGVILAVCAAAVAEKAAPAPARQSGAQAPASAPAPAAADDDQVAVLRAQAEARRSAAIEKESAAAAAAASEERRQADSATKIQAQARVCCTLLRMLMPVKLGSLFFWILMQRKAAEKRVAELKRAGGTPSAPTPAETHTATVEVGAAEPVPAPMCVF